MHPVSRLAVHVAALSVFLAAAQPVVDDKLLEGRGDAHELPEGMAWLNTKNPIQLRQLRGKFVLLDFWTFCCINCMHIIPDLKRLETKYAEELVVVGVHSAKFQNEKETGQIREAVIRYGIPHPIVNDADFRVWKMYGARAWPTVVLINPEGKIIGSMSGEGVFDPVDRILAKGVPYFVEKGTLRRSPLTLSLERAARPETLLSYPGKVSADEAGGRLFITDSNHNRILITDAAGRILDVIGSGEEGAADGDFQDASLHHPQGTFLYQDRLYIADTENHLIRVADMKARQLRTVLGTGEQARRLNVAGQGREVALNSPWDVVVDRGTVYIAMAGSHQVWSANPATWQAQPFAGSARENIVDGKRPEAAMAQTSGLAVLDGTLYAADSETSSIRGIGLTAGGEVSTVVGKGLFDFGDKDGRCPEARLQHALGVATDGKSLFVADTYNSKIKTISLGTCTVSTVSAGPYNEPGGLAWLRGKLYVADTNNHVVRTVDPKTGKAAVMELTGLEKLLPGKKAAFSGRAVQLAAVEVAPGRSKISVTFPLPKGYKENQNAPLYARWNGGTAAGRTWLVPVDLAKTEATLDAIVYYCTEAENVCLVDRIHAVIPLRRSANAPAQVPIGLPVHVPGSRDLP